jgi:hypothetical protein
MRSAHTGFLTCTTVLLVAFGVLVGLAMVLSSRITVESKTFPVEGGKIVVELRDDPVDNLKSVRLRWCPRVGFCQDIHETWGRDGWGYEATLVSVEPQRIEYGGSVFVQGRGGGWRRLPLAGAPEGGGLRVKGRQSH